MKRSTQAGRQPVLILRARDFAIASLILAALKLDQAIPLSWLEVISPLALAWLLTRLGQLLKTIYLAWKASDRIQ